MPQPERKPQAGIARGVGSLYLSQLVTIPLSVATNILAGRYLDPADYGAFTTANFLVSALCLISDAGLAAALVRHPGELERRDYASVFSYQALVGILLAAFLLVGAPLLESFFGGGDSMIRMVRLLSIVPLMNALMTIPLVQIERELRYDRLALFGLAWAVLERVILIACIVAGLKGFSYVYSRLFGLFLQVASLLVLSRWSPLRLLVESARQGWQGRAHLIFGFKVQLRATSSTWVSSIIPGLGGKLLGTTEVGLIAWAHNLATMVGQPLPQSFGKVLVGYTGRFGSSPEAIRDFIGRAILVCTVISGTLLAVGGALLPDAIGLLFKPAWKDAVPFFWLSSLIMAQAIVLTIYDSFVMAAGYPMLCVRANVVWGLAAYAICIPLHRLYGTHGFVVGFILATFVPILLLHLKARQHFRIQWVRHFLAPLSLAAAIGLATFKTKGWFVNGIFSLLAYGAVATLAGFALQAALNPAIVDELRTRFRKNSSA